MLVLIHNVTSPIDGVGINRGEEEKQEELKLPELNLKSMEALCMREIFAQIYNAKCEE